jgi:uncharacterized cofD-like protein
MDTRDWRRWLRPGMAVKRWFLLLSLGSLVTSLALAMGLAWIYRNVHFPDSVGPFVRAVTLQFIAHPWREMILLAIGASAVAIGFVRISRSVVSPLMDMIDSDLPLVTLLQQQRDSTRAAKPLNVVAIGGGTGLATLLRGLKTRPEFDITAIVTVADDGGSTGRIRREFDIPAPGDIRNCIVALAEEESTVAHLFNYRFDKDGSELHGHSFGNLYITAMTQVTGSFEQAVIESADVLAIRGQVFPSTLENIQLGAEFRDGTVVIGESAIGHSSKRIARLFIHALDRSDGTAPRVYEPAITAIRAADLIVLGPGSLYTSVIPNLLFEQIASAVRASRAPVIYICNVATQVGETDGFTARDHIDEVRRYLGDAEISHILVNNNRAVEAASRRAGVEPVTDAGLSDMIDGARVVRCDVVSDLNPLRHDPQKLADVLFELVAAQPADAPVRAIDALTHAR